MHRTNRPSEVLEFARRHEVRMVDLRFCSWTGTWQHLSLPSHRLSEDRLRDGIQLPPGVLFELQKESNDPLPDSVIFRADCTSARIDPFMLEPTLVLQGELCHPDSGHALAGCSRSIAKRALAYMQEEGVAQQCLVGLESDFFVFDDVRFSNRVNMAGYRLDSAIGDWNSDREEFPNLGYKNYDGHRNRIKDQPLPPNDVHHDLRGTIVNVLEDLEVAVAYHQNGARGPGQSTIGLARTSLLEQADGVFWLKYVVKNVARRAGLVATFMPRPLAGQHESRLKWMFSLWHSNRALFFGDGPEGLGETALHFAAGIFEHAAALSAFTRSSTNSFRRIAQPSAQCSIGDDTRGLARAVNCPSMIAHPEDAHLESRNSDAAGNAYLMFAAWLMAGLDGVKRRLAAQQSSESISTATIEDIFKRSECITPQNFRIALDALEKDHRFLSEGNAFDPKTLLAWIGRRREEELDIIAQQPHPVEFELYFQV